MSDNMLREKIAQEIYATLHHLMRVSGTEAQDAYERAAKGIAALPEIAQALAMRENVIRAMQEKGDKAMATIGENMMESLLNRPCG